MNRIAPPSALCEDGRWKYDMVETRKMMKMAEAERKAVEGKKEPGEAKEGGEKESDK